MKELDLFFYRKRRKINMTDFGEGTIFFFTRRKFEEQKKSNMKKIRK